MHSRMQFARDDQPEMSHFTVDDFERLFLNMGADLVSLDEAQKLLERHHLGLLTHQAGWRCTVEVDDDPTFGHVENYYVLTNEFAAIVRQRLTRLRGSETLIMQRKMTADAMRDFVNGRTEMTPLVYNFFETHHDKIFELVDFDHDTVEWEATDGKVVVGVIMSYDYADLDDPVKIKLDCQPARIED